MVNLYVFPFVYAQALVASIRIKKAGNKNFMEAPENILPTYPTVRRKKVGARVKMLVKKAVV
jgi:hypothetical protein